jgi:hypothetical protein
MACFAFYFLSSCVLESEPGETSNSRPICWQPHKVPGQLYQVKVAQNAAFEEPGLLLPAFEQGDKWIFGRKRTELRNAVLARGRFLVSFKQALGVVDRENPRFFPPSLINPPSPCPHEQRRFISPVGRLVLGGRADRNAGG